MKDCMKPFSAGPARLASVALAVAVLALPLPSLAQPKASAPVSIVDPLPVPIRDADNPLRNPFQAEICTGDCSGRSASFTTPARPLVIEYISAWCTIASAVNLTGLFVQTTAGGIQVSHVAGIPHFVTPTSSGAFKLFNFAQLVRIYADPSTTVSMRGDTIGGSNYRCDINISGHTTGP